MSDIENTLDRSRASWTAIIFGFVFVQGAIMQVRGPLLPLIGRTYTVPASVLGLVGPAATTGFVLAIMAGGFRAGSVEMKPMLEVGTVLTGISAAAIAWSPSVWGLIVLLGIQGSATGLFRAFDRPILSHLYPQTRSRVLSYYTAVWAAGAATAPFLANVVTDAYSWRVVYLLFVVPFGAFAVLVHYAGKPANTAHERSLSRSRFAELLGTTRVTVPLCLLLLSGGIEASIFTWYPYFARTFVDGSTANLLLTYFFLAYIPGRFFYGYVMRYVDNLGLVLLLAVGSIPAMYVSIVDAAFVDPVFVDAGIATTGFLVSGLFPALYAYVTNQVPEHSGPVNSLSTGASLGGGIVAVMLIGVLVGAFDVGLAMTVPLVLAAAIVASLVAVELGRT